MNDMGQMIHIWGEFPGPAIRLRALVDTRELCEDARSCLQGA